MRIIGIDPGYAIIGFAVIDCDRDEELISYGVIRTKAKDSYTDRLREIVENINYLFDNYKPDFMAIEKLFFFKNQKTVMKVSEARGIVLSLAIQKGIPFNEYTPLEIKQTITSYGRASKKQVQQMVKNMLCLDHIPQPDDAADAIACALTHVRQTKLENMDYE